jgi:hypothetical protein
MSWSIALVCEAPADRDTATALVTRIACETIDWMEPEYLTYRGFLATESQLLWKHVKSVAGANRVTVTGFMRGAPPSPDAHNAMRALLLFTRCTEQVGKVDAVLLIRDSDNDLGRRDGLNQARDHEPWPFAIVIGFAHTKRECWHIACFEPQDDTERSRVDRLRQELGFNPCEKSEELTAKHDAANDKRSAKRVLDVLTSGDRDREQACVLTLPLPEIARRGSSNGLTEFLNEVVTRLFPVFGHHVPPSG